MTAIGQRMRVLRKNEMSGAICREKYQAVRVSLRRAVALLAVARPRLDRGSTEARPRLNRGSTAAQPRLD